MTVVVGTAGHIDHGKSTLLRALTGIDPDRLPEERRRGMTIDVGYAHLRLADGRELDFVDVPGHDRLVGNMLVGAGEIDAALLVVAADDGPRPQTLEHLELLDALGIDAGLVAVTKADLAGPVRTGAVVDAVRGLLGRTTLAGSPVLAVSSVTGAGLDDLRAALDALSRDVSTRRAAGTGTGVGRGGPGMRLAVDRVFSVKGRGAVVTGSLRGGRLERGAALRVEPGGGSVRAREVQVHGAPVTAVDGGGRVALNLAGAEGADLRRGVVVTDDPAVYSTDRLLAILRPPARLDDRAPAPRWPPSGGATFRLHLGTEAVDATIRRGARDGASLPDGRQVATLRLAHPIAAALGDPFVLRIPSPAATAAGGVVLDLAPPVGVSRRRTTSASLEALASAWSSGSVAAERAARVGLHGLFPAPSAGSAPDGARSVAGWHVASAIVAGLEAEALAAVAAHREAKPLAPGAPLARIRRVLARSVRRVVTADERTATALSGGVIDGLVAAGRLARVGEVVRDPERSSGTLPPAVVAAMDRLEAALAVPAPPRLTDAIRAARCPPEGVRILEAAGRIVRVETDLAWAGSTYRELEALALRLATPGPLAPAALRDATGTSRKYVMALLEDLDRRGILSRTPAGHVLGPRAPR